MSLKPFAKSVLVWALTASIACPVPAMAALTGIATEPMAQPASNVKANLMLILDDSGSMRQQYTPDYLGRYFGGSNAFCHDSRDSSANITGSLKDCEPGDPPLMSPDINTQYYNPEIRYFPAVNYDGSSKTNMTAANTTNWTAVPTDNVSVSTTTFKRDTLDMNGDNNVVISTVNLVTGYPDRVWCTTQSDTATNTTLCKTNSGYSYPNMEFGYGLDTGGNVKYKTGSPYYYRLATTEYCTNTALTTCTASTVPTTVSGVAYNVPGKVRYCANSTLASCQGKYSSTSFPYPKYVGNVDPGAAGSAGSIASGTITISAQKDTSGATISSVQVGGVIITSGSMTLPASFAVNAAATSIKNNINGFVSTPDYIATCAGDSVGNTSTNCTGGVVTVKRTAAAVDSGAITVNFAGPITRTAAKAYVDISGLGNSRTISLSHQGIALTASGITCSSCGGSNSARSIWMANALVNAINSQATATGNGYSAALTAVGSNRFIVTAPSSQGSALNGTALVKSGNGASNLTAYAPSTSDGSGNPLFVEGITAGDVDLVTTAMSGGAAAVPALTPFRQNLGSFSRVDIVPFADAPTNSVASTFTKYVSRTDCAGSACTYAEEMTNFANWFAYYRSRQQMAKTAIGRAFVGLSDSYRVGFITINPSSPVSSSRFLAVNDFSSTGTGSQKELWYDKLYRTADNGSTPLREALSRVGRYFANVTTGINNGMGASPIQYSCQPNYAILTTDGYWNGNAGQTLTDNTTVGNQDNVNSGFSTRAVGAYDGAVTGASDTLADVAMYYYKTDLRSDLADLVPTTQRDTASHQHLTTFTVGMGLAGLLNYDPNYEEQTSGDFFDIKQGTRNWPNPNSGSEEGKLDDLWHAAVNARGKFFSAQNPADLANGIADTLNSIQSRVGAGAAAATSNLQPVAGDNFAFTAQFQTVEWTGDLKARTIDLNSGIVASRELWSAQTLLDLRTHASRKIYAFDSADTTVLAPANGNKLRSFCWPGQGAMVDGGGALLYPNCTDGAGLTAAELSTHFNPTGGTNGALSQSTGWSSDSTGRDVSATAQKLVDFIRGDASNEILNTTSPTASDLFRNRAHLLGDIVNAQPAYVKGSPFYYNSSSYAGTDPYYTEYKNSTNGITATRKGTVYVAANDGMLHAFETDPDNVPYYQTAGISTGVTTDDTFTGTLNTSETTGEGSERWAYIPSMVFSSLKRLADTPYTHRYLTDGTPLVGDVCFDHTTATPCSAQNKWRTILVAGLNAGGRGYYALDVTDPDNPKGLWELKGGSSETCLTDTQANSGTFFGDCNIGLTFGNPLVVKRKSDGKWVVIVTSGYNNVSPGDGVGYLYVVDAKTGAILQRFKTGVGDTTTPSGLGRINAWVDNAIYDNTALSVYAGDLLGNVWRFGFDPSDTTNYNSATALTAKKLITLVDGSSVAQPITAKPELAEVSGYRVVYVGTGQLLGTADKTSLQRQSVYAIRDDMTNTTITYNRTGTGSGLVRQYLQPSSTDQRTVCGTTSATPCATPNPVNFGTDKGWFVDLPDGGTTGNPAERVNVDPIVQLGTLVVPSNVPSADTCTAGGYGWLNFFDFRTGSYVPGATANMASTKIAASLIVGINVVQLPGGKVVTIATTADNQQLTRETPVSPSSVTGRRVSWRELVID